MAEQPPSGGTKSFLSALQTKNPPLFLSLPNNPEISPKTEHLGDLACLYSNEDIQKLSAHYTNVVVGKFIRGRPSMEQLEVSFKTMGFKGKYQIGSLDYKHLLIRFEMEEDRQRCWLKGSWTLLGFPMLVTKWTPDFSPSSDSPIVPIWVMIQDIPVFYYNLTTIKNIANSIGTFVKMNLATASLTRPFAGKLCAEIDGFSYEFLRPIYSGYFCGSA